MKHHPRTPARVLAAALCFLAAATVLHAGSNWRDFPVERKPGSFPVGNQDFSTTDCIGWACRGALLGEPAHASGQSISSPQAIYARAKGFKSQPEEKMDARHGAEALIAMGLVDDYKVLSNPCEIWDWLKYEGPVAAAIFWDEKMTSHRGGLREISVTNSTVRTGKAHAITILGWNAEKRAFYFTPNLGTGWGSRGYALLRETDFPYVFVNAVGFVHDRKLSRSAIGTEPPGDRGARLKAAKANPWYNAAGTMDFVQAGERLIPGRVAVGNAPAETDTAAEQPAIVVSKDPASSSAASAPKTERRKVPAPRFVLPIRFNIEFSPRETEEGEADATTKANSCPRRAEPFGKRR